MEVFNVGSRASASHWMAASHWGSHRPQAASWQRSLGSTPNTAVTELFCLSGFRPCMEKSSDPKEVKKDLTSMALKTRSTPCRHMSWDGESFRSLLWWKRERAADLWDVGEKAVWGQLFGAAPRVRGVLRAPCSSRQSIAHGLLNNFPFWAVKHLQNGWMVFGPGTSLFRLKIQSEFLSCTGVCLWTLIWMTMFYQRCLRVGIGLAHNFVDRGDVRHHHFVQKK